MKNDKETGIETLRNVVDILGNCNESFNQRYTALQLIQIVEMLWKCEWDVLPDVWKDWQVKAALRGKVPQFREMTNEDDPWGENVIRQAGLIAIRPSKIESSS